MTIFIEVVAALWAEGPLHCKRNVVVGISDVLDHEVSVKECRFSEGGGINLVKFELWFEFGGKLCIEKGSELLIVGRA